MTSSMRDDFDRVVIERPRHGSRRGNLKSGWSITRFDPDADYAPPSVTRGKEKSKCFNDHLSPLIRYLGKQVGRPWRKVEGQVRAGLDLSTISGRHLLDHVLRAVRTEIRMSPDGHAHDLRGHPIRDLFVHPRSGLLLRQRPWKTDPVAASRKRVAEATFVRLDAAVTAEKLKGLWYLFIDEHRTEEVTIVRKDQRGAPVAFRSTRPVIRKKQANTEELRRIREVLERTLR